MENNNPKKDNPPIFDSYSSKITSIFIPMRDVSGDEECFYVKREKLHRKLKGWLGTPGKGVYLIAGYRGMGKTCFVNEVLKDIDCDRITREEKEEKPVTDLKNKKRFLAEWKFLKIWTFLNIFSYWGIAIFCIYSFSCLMKPNLISPTSFYIYMLILMGIVYGATSYIKAYKPVKDKYKISIKLNLGPEVIKERDVLALIVNMLQKQYEKYKSTMRYTHPIHKIAWLIVNSVLCVLFSHVLFQGLSTWIEIAECKNCCIYFLDETINDQSLIIFFILCFSTYCLINRMLTKTIYLLSRSILDLKSIPSVILRDIAVLNERINSVVSKEESMTLAIKNYLFGKKKGNTYPLADVREIEQELNTIFEHIEKGERLMLKVPEFIIVFDELDKIDNVSSADEKNEAELIPEYENATSGFPGGATSRKRMQNVLNLLANMKYFINTAKAKFIFVSGREIYDSSLSDVSDREFAISSVFNGIIYLDSFLSSKDNMKEVSSMTEKYICKRLMSDECFRSDTEKNAKGEHADDKYSLRNYCLFLEDVYKNANTDKLTDSDRFLIDRTVMQLYHFSVYLTHVSNGAPKKIAAYFEKYVVHYDREDIKDGVVIIKEVGVKKKVEKKGIFKKIAAYFEKQVAHCDREGIENGVVKEGVEEKKAKGKKVKEKPIWYLAFTYRDQQKINFIHYMAYPVMQAIINTSGNFGDKLLLSAAFLTDHIYKHHKDGFSWRNLELVPELLDANKTPELRSFINSIIGFLKQTHLSVMYSSVYTLKFPRRISEEISVFSKVSEEISAIFNFTSEETLSVKLYYAKLLNYYGKNASDQTAQPEQSTYNRTLANIHHILADLYLSEEDFTNAIFEYQRCSALLDKIPMTPSALLFYIRNMLKLGLAYEKRNTFDSAYFIYQEIITLLIKHRFFDEKKFKMVYDKKEDKVILQRGYENFNQNRIVKKELLPYLIKNHLNEMDDLIPKLALFEDVRFIYQPLLAKLLVTEKMEYCGVTRNKMAETEEEFKFLRFLINEEERFFIIANFYREMGNIMYYKNGFLQFKMLPNNEESQDNKKEPQDKNEWHDSDPIRAWDLREYDIENAIQHYCEEHKEAEKRRNDMICFFKNLSETELCEIVKKRENVVDAIVEHQRDNVEQSELWNPSNSDELIKTIKELANEYMIINDNMTENDVVKKSTQKQAKIDSYKKDSRIIFDKLSECNKRRSECKYNKGYYPCYACKFFNKSLRILIKKVFNVGQGELKSTKSILLWEQIANMKTPPREDTLVLIAGILDAFGSVMVSCSYTKKDGNNISDDISGNFLKSFFKAIKAQKKDGMERIEIRDCFKGFSSVGSSMSFLEKGILYFWVASEYYSSSKSKEAFYCREKIIDIFLYYIKMNKKNTTDLIASLNYKKSDKKDIVDIIASLNNIRMNKKRITDIITSLDYIKIYIVDDSIRYLYSNYDKINIAELQKIKWFFSKEMLQDVSLKNLSLFPDIEPLLSAYYELCIEMKEDRLNENDGLGLSLVSLYNNPILNSNRLESTITARVSSLHLKARYNRMIFECLFGQNFFMSAGKAKDDRKFNKKVMSYLRNIESLYEILQQKGLDLFDKKEASSTVTTYFEKMKFLLFLVKDSLFCLSITIEKLAPIKDITLFSQSYIAETYYEMYGWNRIYELLYHLIVKKDADCSIEFNNLFSEDDMNKLKKELQEIEKDNATSSRVNYLNTNYCAEMAINHYRIAQELHSEGKAYKDFISNLHIQNDDLNNNTFQFQHAIERYLINSGYIESKSRGLKNKFGVSGIYDVNNYVRVEI